MVNRGAAEMSTETIIALMLAAFAASPAVGHVVTAFWLRGHVYTAAFIVIAYLVACLGMVIYALA